MQTNKRLPYPADVKLKARELRSNSTKAERALWQQLRRRQLSGYRFRRQQPLGRYFVDFYCHEKRLAIELDGGQHGEQADYDTKRTAWLESEGYRVLRFWNTAVMSDIETVKQVILDTLESQETPLVQPGT